MPKPPIDHIETQTIVIGPKQAPIRVDKFVTERLPKISRNRIQNGIKRGTILVDGKQVKVNHLVNPGEVITIEVPRYRPEGEAAVIPQDIPLDVRYEDDHLMVIYKPAGMVVHPAPGHRDGTVVNALKFYLDSEEIPTLAGNDASRVGLVHRIDKDTSGLLLVAKTDDAMTHLAKQFFDHTIDRVYQAVCWGEPDPPAGTIDAHLGRDINNRQRYRVFEDPEDNHKHAITHYETLEGLYYVSLLQLKLETGRTHQIRVHMQSIGHPLFSDGRYGGDRIVQGDDLQQIPPVRRALFRALPPAGSPRQVAGFHPPGDGRADVFRERLA